MDSTAIDYGGKPTPKHLQKRLLSLESERSVLVPDWQQASDFILPNNGRFNQDTGNRGQRRHNSIINSRATRSCERMVAGIMASETSPSRPWFELTTRDRSVALVQPVAEWLHAVTEQILGVMATGNTYQSFQHLYREMGCFGTACSIVLPSFDRVIWHYPVTIGEFSIAQDYEGNVNTLYRKFNMTTAQVIRRFGKENCSSVVVKSWDEGQWDRAVTVCHAIEERHASERVDGDNRAKNKVWRSCFFEVGQPDRDEKFLSESGFDRFPGVVPRWSVVGTNTYGSNHPGAECLGDVKGLQIKEKRLQNAIEFMSNPPTQGPTSLKDQDIKRFPGGHTVSDTNSQNGGVRNLFEVRLDINALSMDIQRDERRISEAWFEDLFLMFASDTRSTPATAKEIAERMTEKMVLGPLATRFENEIQRPVIQMIFERLIETGAVPPIPEELSGHELDIESLGVMSQAQRMVGIGGIDRWLGGLGVIAQMKPEALDLLDTDRYAEIYAQKCGSDPRMIVAGPQVALIRQARAQAEAAKEQTAMMETQSKTVRALAGSQTSEPSVLTALAGAQ